MRRTHLVAFAVVLVLVAGAAVGYVAWRPRSHPPAAAAALPVPRPAALRQAPVAPVPDPAVLAARLRPLLAARGLDDAGPGRVSALVEDARTGRVLFARRPDVGVPPASTAKLATAVVALRRLGGDATLTTSVRRRGRTLYLVGGGDVTLTGRRVSGYPATATLSALVRRTAAALPPTGGPLRIRYDAGAWSGPALARGWNAGYFAADIARLSPLELDEGRLRHTDPDRVGDPADAAARAFATALAGAGVDVSGQPRPATVPSDATPVAAVDSAPVSALVQRMLTVSDNDLAEALGRAVAVRTGRPATFAGEAAALVEGLGVAQVPTHGVRLYDASGLSHDDRIPVRTLLALLRLAQHTAALAPVVAGLPVAGATGTLADRDRHRATAPAAGVVRAKTGTLDGVSALAGQVVDADGRLLDFAVITAAAPSPASAEADLDRVASALASCGCRG